MFNSKLLNLYRTLNEQEIRQFKKWIYSPIHNEHKDVQKLFQFLFTRYSLSLITLKKERAWSYIYPQKPYKDLRLRHLMSFSFDLLESFVRYKISVQDNFYQKKNLVGHYFEHKMIRSAAINIQKIENELNSEVSHDEQHHFHQYELEVLKFDLAGKQDRTLSTNITKITRHASLFFMITTLRHAYTALSHQNLRKTNYNIPLLEAVLAEVEQNDYEQHPILMIYYHAYYTLKTPTKDSHFHRLKYYLTDKASHLGFKEQRAVLLIAINYSIKRMNSGSDHYAQEAVDLYKKGLANNLLLEHGTLSRFAYKNIVSLCIFLKAYAWAEQFILNYTPKLELALQESYKHYSQSRLSFAKNEFDKAMKLLTQVEYDDLVLNMGAKVMLLKLYYQQGHWDSLDALLESFRIFLNRKKVMAYHKMHYMNLISLTKKILSTPAFDKELIQKLKKQIEETNPLAEREWLLLQVEEL